jgi:hypothetical protein
VLRRSSPRSAPDSWRIESSVRAIASSTSSADRSSRSPAGVSIIRLPTRRNSAVPSRDSMSRSWWLSADWVRLSTDPAPVRLPAAVTARTSLRWRISRSILTNYIRSSL